MAKTPDLGGVDQLKQSIGTQSAGDLTVPQSAPEQDVGDLDSHRLATSLDHPRGSVRLSHLNLEVSELLRFVGNGLLQSVKYNKSTLVFDLADPTNYEGFSFTGTNIDYMTGTKTYTKLYRDTVVIGTSALWMKIDISAGALPGTRVTAYNATSYASPAEITIDGSGTKILLLTNESVSVVWSGSAWIPFLRNVPQILSIGQSLTVARTGGNANTWVDYSNRFAIGVAGFVGQYFRITVNVMYAPGNSGYNHVRWYSYGGNSSVYYDGQMGYITQLTFMPLVAICKLTATSDTLWLQDWSNGTTGTATLYAGAGGADSSQMTFVVEKLEGF